MSREILNNDRLSIESLVKECFNGETIQTIERLGGLTNHTYCVTLPSGAYVFRLPGDGTEEIISRENEKVSNELACKIDIDSPLIRFDDKGVKICEYIKDAQTLNVQTLSQRENLKLAAELLRKLHDCGEDTKVEFNPFTLADDYERFILSNHVSMYDDYKEMREKVLAVQDHLKDMDVKLVPCHNDPLCENWVRSNEKIYLIDWEYAGMNDPYWDVADVAIEAELNEDDSFYLLKEYLGHDIALENKERFLANEIYLDFLWSLWGKTRVPFDDTMEDYALARYERMKKNLKAWEELTCTQD